MPAVKWIRSKIEWPVVFEYIVAVGEMPIPVDIWVQVKPEVTA